MWVGCSLWLLFAWPNWLMWSGVFSGSGRTAGTLHPFSHHLGPTRASPALPRMPSHGSQGTCWRSRSRPRLGPERGYKVMQPAAPSIPTVTATVRLCHHCSVSDPPPPHTNPPYHHRCHTASPASLHHPDCSRPPLNKEQCVLHVDWFVIPRSSWCHPHPRYSGCFFSNRMLAPSPPCVSFGCSFGCCFFCNACFSLFLMFPVFPLSAFPCFLKLPFICFSFHPPPPPLFFLLPLSTFFALSVIIMPALFCSFWPLIFPALYNTWLSVPRWGTDASSWQGARSPSTTLRLWRPWFAAAWSAPVSLTSTCPACWRPAPTRPSASSCRSFSASAPMTRTARTTSQRWVGSSSCGQGQLSSGTDWQHLAGVTLKARDSSTDQKLLRSSVELYALGFVTDFIGGGLIGVIWVSRLQLRSGCHAHSKRHSSTDLKLLRSSVELYALGFVTDLIGLGGGGGGVIGGSFSSLLGLLLHHLFCLWNFCRCFTYVWEYIFWLALGWYGERLNLNQLGLRLPGTERHFVALVGDVCFSGENSV